MEQKPVLPPGKPGGPRRFTDEQMMEFCRAYLKIGANRSKVAREHGYKFIQNARREVKAFLARNPEFAASINEKGPDLSEPNETAVSGIATNETVPEVAP